MEKLNSTKIFKAIVSKIKQEGRWPEDMIDYAIASEYRAVDLPLADSEITAEADFGGSEGIYIDVVANIYTDNDEATSSHFGTIKTLMEDVEAYRRFAELAADFKWYSREVIRDIVLDRPMSYLPVIYGRHCTLEDEWREEHPSTSYVLGRDMDDPDWWYAKADGPYGKWENEYDNKPDREKVASDYIDYISARDLDRYEAEFGADGTRVFRPVESPTSEKSLADLFSAYIEREEKYREIGSIYDDLRDIGTTDKQLEELGLGWYLDLKKELAATESMDQFVDRMISGKEITQDPAEQAVVGIAWSVKDEGYLLIDVSDDGPGWRYQLVADDYRTKKEGVIELPDFSVNEIKDLVVRNFKLDPSELTQTNYEVVYDNVCDVAEEDLTDELNKAEAVRIANKILKMDSEQLYRFFPYPPSQEAHEAEWIAERILKGDTSEIKKALASGSFDPYEADKILKRIDRLNDNIHPPEEKESGRIDVVEEPSQAYEYDNEEYVSAETEPQVTKSQSQEYDF